MLRPASLLLCVAAFACTAPAGDELDEVTVDPDSKADAASEIRTRIDGLTVWIDAAMVADAGGWVIEGRASRNLDGVSSWVPDDAFATATVTGARTFEVRFEPGHELDTLLSGLPIFIDLDPTTGAGATAAVWVSPRLTAMTGTSRIYLHTAIDPIWVAYELVYRAKATLSTGWGELQVWTDGGPAPQAVSTGGRGWRIDMGYEALAGGLGAGRPVHAAAYKDGAPVEKAASVALKVTKVGLTRGDAAQVWERTCDDDVAACLAGLPEGTVDTAACGRYREVQACGGLDVPEAPAGVTMADDLRAHLVGWYADHGADVAAAGGNTLAQAQAAVDANGFSRVTNADEDPEAHDQATTWVFRHADVVYPGSDIVWFVAYDKSTGALVRVYDFN
jgi:hypothetical protein